MFKLNRLLHPLKERKIFRKRGSNQRDIDFVFLSLMIMGFVFLGALLFYNVYPIKTIEIKVPVATDQSSYAQGEEISGIFFGQNYYTGHTKILREVFCKDYKGVVKPPAGNADGDFFSTRTEPFKYEGVTRRIGNLPLEVPVGSNCVLKFTNIYEIQTPFGIRKETVEYYTQNFAIISQERRNLLDCEATGRADCSDQSSANPEQGDTDTGAFFPMNADSGTQPLQPSQQVPAPKASQTPTTPATEPTVPPSEPVTPPTRNCRIDLLFIHLFC